MRRKLFTVAAGASAVLCAGYTVSAVVDSLFVHDTVARGNTRVPTAACYVILALATGTVPALWLRSRTKHNHRLQRLLLSLCRACRYDLRATPTRCPECGAVPERVVDSG